MSAYYNEHDAYAAQWLRNLISAGHIADGVVDERSIEDVCPADLRDFTQCHFFAGIGVWSHALRGAGWPDDRPVWTGSCPCQPFSAAGKGAGFDDERHLWPAWHHLIGERRPPVVFGEQVASSDAMPWIDLVQDDLEGMGYAFGAVPFPAAGVGAPHIRDRMYFVADADIQPRRQGRPNDGGQHPRGVARPWSRSGGGVMPNVLADAADARPQGRDEPGQRADAQRSTAERSGAAGDVEHAASNGRQQRRAESGGRGAVGGCGAGGLADADGGHSSAERQQRGGEYGQQSEDGGARKLGDTDGLGEGTERRVWRGPDAERTGVSADRPAGPTNGFWRDADWLLCRDGRWRPVDPGTFPLAHGVANRVGRLRAYGNAICAPQAAVFIRCVMA